jgi:D-alanyl-D-alanine carboxypeptidase
MSLSHKIWRLLVISITIIILAISANEGVKNDEKIHIKPSQIGIPYPYVPLDIDPNIIDKSIGSVVPKTVDIVKVNPKHRPLVSAEAYLVANLDTGEIYSEYNPKSVFPIASLTKLVTALVTMKNIPPDQKITITQSMLDSYGEAGGLMLGETFTASDLVYPLLLESSNDSAEALAQSYGYGDFIAKMNAFVKEIGMSYTVFRDVSGLSPGNVSNTKDLLILARYLYTSEPSLLTLTKEISMKVATTTDHGFHKWNTINPFPLDPHFIGGKTGRTLEAKESMISLFRYEYNGISYPVVIIVLRSDFKVRELDSAFLFEQFMDKLRVR